MCMQHVARCDANRWTFNKAVSWRRIPQSRGCWRQQEKQLGHSFQERKARASVWAAGWTSHIRSGNSGGATRNQSFDRRRGCKVLKIVLVIVSPALMSQSRFLCGNKLPGFWWQKPGQAHLAKRNGLEIIFSARFQSQRSVQIFHL